MGCGSSVQTQQPNAGPALAEPTFEPNKNIGKKDESFTETTENDNLNHCDKTVSGAKNEDDTQIISQNTKSEEKEPTVLAEMPVDKTNSESDQIQNQDTTGIHDEDYTGKADSNKLEAISTEAGHEEQKTREEIGLASFQGKETKHSISGPDLLYRNPVLVPEPNTNTFHIPVKHDGDHFESWPEMSTTAKKEIKGHLEDTESDSDQLDHGTIITLNDGNDTPVLSRSSSGLTSVTDTDMASNIGAGPPRNSLSGTSSPVSISSSSSDELKTNTEHKINSAVEYSSVEKNVHAQGIEDLEMREQKFLLQPQQDDARAEGYENGGEMVLDKNKAQNTPVFTADTLHNKGVNPSEKEAQLIEDAMTKLDEKIDVTTTAAAQGLERNDENICSGYDNVLYSQNGDSSLHEQKVALYEKAGQQEGVVLDHSMLETEKRGQAGIVRGEDLAICEVGNQGTVEDVGAESGAAVVEAARDPDLQCASPDSGLHGSISNFSRENTEENTAVIAESKIEITRQEVNAGQRTDIDVDTKMTPDNEQIQSPLEAYANNANEELKHEERPGNVNEENTKEINPSGPTEFSSSTVTSAAEESKKDMPKDNRPTDCTKNSSTEESGNSIGQTDQEQFDVALRFACSLIKPDCIFSLATSNVRKLTLPRAPPPGLNLSKLVTCLTHTQEIDLSGNNLGPQGFRAVILSLCQNTTITSLNIANNMTDTDCAVSVGKLLESNASLITLDLSGNHLGKDFFSRCAGPAMKTNTSLRALKCQSIGATDLTVFFENVLNNSTLEDIDFSHNEMTNGMAVSQLLGDWIKGSSCKLRSLQLRNFGLKGDAMKPLMQAVAANSSLEELNVGMNEFTSSTDFMDSLCICVNHKKLTRLVLDDCKSVTVEEWTAAEAPSPIEASPLSVLSLSNCSLNDQLLSSLASAYSGRLVHLRDVSLNSNASITEKALQYVEDLSTEKDSTGSSLERLSVGMNNMENLPAFLCSTVRLPKLKYLNLRKATMSPAAVGKLAPVLTSGRISTLVIDGIKLSKSNALSEILSAGPSSSLNALSLSSCAIDDEDLKPLCSAVRDGLPLHMLKLSNNRFSDAFVEDMVGALVSQTTHPLALIDASVNQISSAGAMKFCELFTSSSHQTNIHSLNLSNNNIDHQGVKALVGCVGKTSLTSLHLNSQSKSCEEEEMDEVLTSLAQALGLTVQGSGEAVVEACSDLPKVNVGPYTVVQLNNLGGNTGHMGSMLDCSAISTDYKKKKLPHLSFHHALQLASAFKGYDSPECLLSSDEWNMIIGADKEAPSWLQIADHRDTAVYMSQLPASITVQKMEGILEMEADCEVQEVCLMKDPINRKNNGLAWVLLADKVSVERAEKFFNSGEALVFGQAFMLSRVAVKIDDQANTEAEKVARLDMERRIQERRAAEREHRTLIQTSYATSQARHAYMLANPAYADGRVW